MNGFARGKIKFFFLIAILVVVFGAGFFIGNDAGKKQVVCRVCALENVNMSLFWETWTKLQEKYVNPKDLDVQKMVYGAISGMVKAVGNPYTVFFNPEDTKRFYADVSGRFEGVGMEIGERKGQIQVVAPIEGTPAQHAGLRSGDKIIKINDTFTSDLSAEEAVNMIRGPQGTEVRLTIFRDEWGTTKEFTLKRQVIEVPSLKWELKQENIAYVRLYQFSENAGSDFSKVAMEILKSPAQKIILDLRDNPGGYLEVSQDIAGWFLKDGQTVVTEDFGGKQESKVYYAQGNGKLGTYPIVVLINKGTASAAEILASALRDNLSVKLIGETSFGKGSVQEVEDLGGGSSLKVTVAKWLTPKGKLIAEVGLDPDVKIVMSDKDYEAGKDPQLEKAIEIMEKVQ